ncbi:MAG: lipid-A-disaccharide synthase-related protein [Betaproteobacteria bacterium]
MRTVLFLSNGHGEDTVGARIAREVVQTLAAQGLSSVRVVAMPIVGLGNPYRKAGIETVGPQQALPSGGLIYLNRTNLRQDLKAGLLGLIKAQIRFLRAMRRETDLVVGVGDKVILALNALFLKKPMIFVGVADSYYYNMGARPVFTPWERWIMRRTCLAVFARDARSAESLREHGVSSATFAGNPMMDTFDLTGEDFGLKEGILPIGILPGSREEAYDNFVSIMRIAAELDHLHPGKLAFLVAVAPSLDLGKLEACFAQLGKPLNVIFTEKFGDVLDRAKLVIGLAGTANEQAAGMGRPVVIFPGTGSQVTPRFVQGQKKLLGEALLVVAREPEAAAREIASLLEDPQRRSRMAAAGVERMGGRGAATAVAAEVLRYLRRPELPRS